MSDAEQPEFAPHGGQHSAIHPQTLFGASVGIALLISAPAWLGAARGEADPLSAGIRFLVGTAVIWGALWLVSSMLGSFVAQADEKAAIAAYEAEQERKAAELQATLEAAAHEAHEAAALESPQS